MSWRDVGKVLALSVGLLLGATAVGLLGVLADHEMGAAWRGCP